MVGEIRASAASNPASSATESAPRVIETMRVAFRSVRGCLFGEKFMEVFAEERIES